MRGVRLLLHIDPVCLQPSGLREIGLPSAALEWTALRLRPCGRLEAGVRDRRRLLQYPSDLAP